MAQRVRAGPLPWNRQKQSKDRQAGYQYNVGVAKLRSDDKSGREYYNTGGYSVYTRDKWHVKPKKAEMVPMQVYGGRMSMVPIGDVLRHIGFDAIPSDYVPDEMAAQANAAFLNSEGPDKYFEVEGVGHIAHLKYNPTFQIMEVDFDTSRNGTGNVQASVTFFRVPSGLYDELRQLAESGTTRRGADGTQRHSLGIRFWDLVRLRGSRTGSRLPFTYGSGGSFSGGSQQGKYVEMAMRQQSPQAQQPLEASDEATSAHTNRPSVSEAARIYQAQLDQNLANAVQEKRMTDLQVQEIGKMRRNLNDRYGSNSPAHREFATAAEKGDYGAVLRVARLYKIL